MTNMSVPTMRDVARFDTAMVANKESQVHEISRVKDTLAQIANPASITSVTDKSKMTQIREQLVRESQAGNSMASTILNASKTMNVVNNSTTNVANSVTNQMTEMLQKISNPQSVTNVTERQKYSTIKQSLTEASEKGDQFATTTLQNISTVVSATNPEAKKEAVKKLKADIAEAEKQGNKVAAQVSQVVAQQTTQAALPAQNTVQTVSLEDYEAVRKMWEKNYQTMDVPQSIDKGTVSRKDWIKDDINSISQTVNMLSSTDAEVVDQGLQEVSNILPFLMMGGFTLPEITAYLKAKQQAATDSLEQLSGKDEEEESMIDATVHRTATAVKHQSATIPTGGAGTGSTGVSDDDDDDEGSVLSGIKSQVVHSTSSVMNIFPSIMNAVSLTPHSTPTLRDVVKYDSTVTSGNETVRTDVTKTQDLLSQLADPTIILNTAEREKVQTLRNQLIKESQTGNPMAVSIMQAATTIASVKTISQQTTTQVRSAIQNILHPESITDATQKATFSEIHEQLTKEKENGNAFATNIIKLGDVILSTSPGSYNEHISVAALKVQVEDEKAKGNVLAEKLQPLFTPSAQSAATIQVRAALTAVLHPETVTDVTRQQEYREIHDLLVSEKEKNNELATVILSTAESVAATPQNSPQEQEQVMRLQQKVREEKQKGNTLAARVQPHLAPSLVAGPVSLPNENKVQTVSLEDYEAVKKMWQENYQTMDVPQSITKGTSTRKEWIEDDIAEITRIINLLSSSDPQVQNEGIAAVSQILPFLLIGGFSLSEIIAYLKAKLEAAKAALGIVTAVENESESQVDVVSADQATPQEQTRAVEQPAEKPEEAPSAVEDIVPDPVSADGAASENAAQPLKELDSEGDPELKDLADEPEGPKELEELEEKQN
jgi:hypothetical protein